MFLVFCNFISRYVIESYSVQDFLEYLKRRIDSMFLTGHIKSLASANKRDRILCTIEGGEGGQFRRRAIPIKVVGQGFQ